MLTQYIKLLVLASLFCILTSTMINAQVMKNYEIKKSFIKDEIIEDIEFILNAVKDVHPNPFHSISKEELIQLKDSVINSLPDTLTRFEAFLAFRLVTAAYQEGHTNVNMYVVDKYIWQLKDIFPIKLDRYFEDKFRVEKNAYSEFDIETGDLILSINGISAKEIHDATVRYYGNIPSYSINSIISYFPFWLKMVNISPPFTIDYLRDGIRRQELITGIDYIYYDTTYQNDHANYSNYSYQVLENNIAYIDFSAFVDLAKFKVFVKETFQDIKNRNIDGLIIDIRNNGGGNSDLGYELIDHFTIKSYDLFGDTQWKVSKRYKDLIIEIDKIAPGKFFDMSEFHEYFQTKDDTILYISASDTLHQPGPNNLRFFGPVCVLIGPKVFSSADAFTDAIKTFQLCTLIGEPLEVPANNYGDICKFLLPNTKFKFDTSVKYFLRLNGNKNDNTPIQPDIHISQTSKDTKAGLDTVIEYAKQWIRDQLD
ncbi:MAG: S41 family peptidase [candidate division Zixibacteria bacterium]|nr:S41 family peptidase [candidate division Zixibacteria bacterium]